MKDNAQNKTNHYALPNQKGRKKSDFDHQLEQMKEKQMNAHLIFQIEDKVTCLGPPMETGYDR